MLDLSQKGETKEHHLVLQKFINSLLFGNTENPYFSDPNLNIKLNQDLLDFSISLNDQTNNNEQLVNDFFNNSITIFRNQINDKDRMNLALCYAESNFRTIVDVLKTFGKGELNTGYDSIENLNKTISKLTLDKEIPSIINDYFKMQFFDILKFTPVKSKSISKEQYQFLTDRYVGEYDHNKILNIVYQKYDDIE